VQYLCYLPKNHIKNDALQRSLRRTCFEERYTTSHWPYPLAIVPAQPRYNYYNPDNKIIIDYTKLQRPQLDDLKTEIEKLL
jgi:hypothetical protein